MSDVPHRDDNIDKAIAEIANALQAAGLLVDLHHRQVADMAQDATELKAAIDRATLAIRRLQRHQRDSALTERQIEA